MKRGPYPLEAVVTLPAGLLFGPEFLGLLKSAEIGGIPVHVVLPKFSFADDEFTTVLHPRARAKWVEYYEKNGDDSRWPFGKVSKWNPQKPDGGIEQFSVSRLLLLSKDRVTLAEGRKLLYAVDSWVARLEAWIEVYAQVDLHRRHVSVEQLGRSAYVWLYKGKGRKGKTVNSIKPVQLIVMGGNPLPISPREWGKLLNKASDGTEPPAAHLFLRDARQLLNSERYRRSVLDSATATEVALTKLRDDYLAQGDSAVGGYVEGKARQISGLEGFVRSVGVPLPGGIQQRVSEPRNDAIHEGKEPSRDVTSKALAKAREVVDTAFPWKGLL